MKVRYKRTWIANCRKRGCAAPPVTWRLARLAAIGWDGSRRLWWAGARAASVTMFFANSRPHPEPARAAKREAGMHKPQAPSVVYRAGPRGHAVRKRFPVHRQAPQSALDDFVPFDDADPMQMGMVVRVMLPVSDASLTGGAQEVAADLLIGEDGRARAIRLVR